MNAHWLINIAQAADASSATPAAFVVDIYNFALLIGGILAFGGIVYGAAKYSLAAGNPSGQSDAKDQMTQAVLGLFLLFGAYYILKTINPDITALGIPNLATLKTAENTNQYTGGLVDCKSLPFRCRDSQAVTAVQSCIKDLSSTDPSVGKNYRAIPNMTYLGAHNPNSCHFGGRTCGDGSHAIDWGFRALKKADVTPQEMVSLVEGCGTTTGKPTKCRCESEGGKEKLPCDSPKANHIHCDVDIAKCGC